MYSAGANFDAKTSARATRPTIVVELITGGSVRLTYSNRKIRTHDAVKPYILDVKMGEQRLQQPFGTSTTQEAVIDIANVGNNVAIELDSVTSGDRWWRRAAQVKIYYGYDEGAWSGDFEVVMHGVIWGTQHTGRTAFGRGVFRLRVIDYLGYQRMLKHAGFHDAGTVNTGVAFDGKNHTVMQVDSVANLHDPDSGANQYAVVYDPVQGVGFRFDDIDTVASPDELDLNPGGGGAYPTVYGWTYADLAVDTDLDIWPTYCGHPVDQWLRILHSSGTRANTPGGGATVYDIYPATWGLNISYNFIDYTQAEVVRDTNWIVSGSIIAHTLASNDERDPFPWIDANICKPFGMWAYTRPNGKICCAVVTEYNRSGCGWPKANIEPKDIFAISGYSWPWQSEIIGKLVHEDTYYWGTGQYDDTKTTHTLGSPIHGIRKVHTNQLLGIGDSAATHRYFGNEAAIINDIEARTDWLMQSPCEVVVTVAYDHYGIEHGDWISIEGPFPDPNDGARTTTKDRPAMVVGTRYRHMEQLIDLRLWFDWAHEYV
jgi:hypothetical protein